MNNDKQNEKTQEPLILEEGTVPPRIVMPGEKKGAVPPTIVRPQLAPPPPQQPTPSTPPQPSQRPSKPGRSGKK